MSKDVKASVSPPPVVAAAAASAQKEKEIVAVFENPSFLDVKEPDVQYNPNWCGWSHVGVHYNAYSLKIVKVLFYTRFKGVQKLLDFHDQDGTVKEWDRYFATLFLCFGNRLVVGGGYDEDTALKLVYDALDTWELPANVVPVRGSTCGCNNGECNAIKDYVLLKELKTYGELCRDLAGFREVRTWGEYCLRKYGHEDKDRQFGHPAVTFMLGDSCGITVEPLTCFPNTVGCYDKKQYTAPFEFQRGFSYYVISFGR